MDVLTKLQALREQGESCVLCTIVKAEGSTPRTLGTKMLVMSDGTIYGTIGGGKLEYLAIEDAKQALASRQNILKRYNLVPEGIGMHCGGSVEVFHEVYAPPFRVVIFGAGHVAEPLADLVLELGYQLTVIDPRLELLNKASFAKPEIEKIGIDYVNGLQQCRLTPETVCFVVSLGQEKEILEAVLPHNPRYVGVLGSKRKIRALREKLLEQGFTEAQWKKVRGPVGLDIGGETPFEIALSIVAELVTELKGGSGKPLTSSQP